MKLLPKVEFEQAKAEAVRKQIEEGQKIAKRIDGLRETLAEEEASLARFRAAQVKALKEEIGSLINERDQLKADIIRMKGELHIT